MRRGVDSQSIAWFCITRRPVVVSVADHGLAMGRGEGGSTVIACRSPPDATAGHRE